MEAQYAAKTQQQLRHYVSIDQGGKRLVLISVICTLNACSLLRYCNTDYSVEDPFPIDYLNCINSLEIVDNNSINVVVDKDCPVYFVDKNGNKINSNVLTVSDAIVLSDIHYGSTAKILSIKNDSVLLEKSESWSYPVEDICSSGESIVNIIVRPYQSENAN